MKSYQLTIYHQIPGYEIVMEFKDEPTRSLLETNQKNNIALALIKSVMMKFNPNQQ